MALCKFIRSVAVPGAFVLAAFPAFAADMYVAPAGPGGGYKDGPFVPVATWTGFYVGVNGGYAFDAHDRHGGMEDNGGFGGGQIGYNWQGAFGLHPNLVFGVEADFQGAGIDNSRYGRFGNGDFELHKRAIDDFGTVRGRIGYSLGQTLVYFTGGFAYGNKNNEFDDLTTGNVYKDGGIHTGYVLGGGLEYKLTPSWSLKAEYQYIELGHDNATDSLGGYVRTLDTELNTVRGGINYHFNSPLEPLK
jgi:outer membrane immunogenic protein